MRLKEDIYQLKSVETEKYGDEVSIPRFEVEVFINN
jgi:hypothetical protein